MVVMVTLVEEETFMVMVAVVAAEMVVALVAVGMVTMDLVMMVLMQEAALVTLEPEVDRAVKTKPVAAEGVADRAAVATAEVVLMVTVEATLMLAVFRFWTQDG